MPALTSFVHVLMRPAARAAARAADLIPVTALGFFALASAAVALFGVGLPRTDLVLLVLGGATLGLGALSLALVALTAAGLWLGRSRAMSQSGGGEPLHMECGVPVRTGFSLSSIRYIPLVQVTWSWVSPAASVEIERGGGRLFEIARAMRRGHEAAIVRRVEISDAFRLMKIAFRVREPRAVRALPDAGALTRLRFAQSASSGSDLPSPFERPVGEPMDLRRYTPGDPMRFILWKTFAKSRQLAVRSPEQAISPASRTAVYLIAGEGDEAAAGAARAALESGALGARWVLGADGEPDVASTIEEAQDALALSGRCPIEQGGAGLAAFLQRHAQDTSTRILLFTPPSPGPWLDRAVSAARARASGRSRGGQFSRNVEVLVCIDGVSRSRGARGWLARLTRLAEAGDPSRESAPSAPNSQSLATVLRALSGSGAEVLLADRRAGRTYSAGAQRALLMAAGGRGAR